MKYILIVFCICSVFFESCETPKKKDASFEEDFCEWIVAEKGYQMAFDDSESGQTFFVEKGRERKQIFVLENVYNKYEVGDTICITKK